MLLVILTAVDRLAQAISLKTNASDCILPRHEIRIITSIGERAKCPCERDTKVR